MKSIKKVLKIVRSQKHKGSIFLKVCGTEDDFLCKIYPQNTECETTTIAKQIITALSPNMEI